MAKNILIVEDDEQLSKVLYRQLEASGYKPVNAYDAESGLKLARAKKPDLIILDIGLPGMDGKTLCKIIKNHPETAGIKIIMLTGDRLVGNMEDSFTSGAETYINKPYDFSLLLAHIEKLIG
jgi:DNA-binding response OmpR family regulator